MIVHNGNIMTVGDAINILELQGSNDLLPSWYFGPEVDELMKKAHLTPWVDTDLYSREEQFRNIEIGQIESIEARAMEFILFKRATGKDIKVEYVNENNLYTILRKTGNYHYNNDFVFRRRSSHNPCR